MKHYVVISGLPASGKSSVGNALAAELGYSFLDKDEFLERLFEKRGVGDAGWRRRLSRESDVLFQEVALSLENAVLTSWWHHPKSRESSGTPVEWLNPYSASCVEVHCQCGALRAAERFTQRSRHPGHLDRLRNATAVRELFERQHRLGPLGIGKLVEVSTESEVLISHVAAEVSELLSLPTRSSDV